MVLNPQGRGGSTELGKALNLIYDGVGAAIFFAKAET